MGRIVIVTVSIHISSGLLILSLPDLVLLYIIIGRSKGLCPENMPDPIRKYFGYGQIRLSASVSVPFFQRRHRQYCAKPTRILFGWSGFGQGLAKRIWSGSKLVCKNHLARFLAGRNRPATIVPLQTLFCSSTDVPDNIVQNQPGSDLVLADCVRFWPNGSSPDASQCARIIRPASGQCFPANRIRYVYWVASLKVY